MGILSKLFGKKTASTPPPSPKSRPTEVIEKEIEEYKLALREFKRMAYIPQTKEGSSTFSSESKFGGYPYLRNENDWPICPNCKKNMQLFLQLNLSELPEKKDEGLIQLFYCTTYEDEGHHCEYDLDAYSPFSEISCCRKIEIGKPSALIKPKLDEVYPEKCIINWNPVDDYPHLEDLDNLGVNLEFEDDVMEQIYEREISETQQGDKLFGWPFWVQGAEYPKDRKTGTEMELLFQLDSEINLPHMFGDSGVGHLTQSPDNKDELGFGWACY